MLPKGGNKRGQSAPTSRLPALRSAIQSTRDRSPLRPAVYIHPYILLHGGVVPSTVPTMTAKPSLKAAEDFLAFVNASPTRQ